MGNIHGKCWTVHLLKEEKNIFPRLFISLALASSTHIPALRNQFALLKKKKWLEALMMMYVFLD